MLENVKIMGRHLEKDGIMYLSFSGSYIEFEFTGKKVEAEILTDYAKNKNLMGYVGVFIDGVFDKKIALDKECGKYTLVEFAEKKTAVIRMMRFSENNFGKVGIRGLSSDGEMRETPYKPLKIEFIGNSITCGYGVEAEKETDQFCTGTENPSKAYACLTAEALDADFQLISWSGNGIVTQWIPPERDEPDVTVPLMQDMYRMADFGGYKFQGFDEPPMYDFNEFVPDLVVINIGTNDASYTRKIPERVENYGKTYRAFLEMVREKRPGAKIVCALGVMNCDLCEIVEAQVKEINKTDGNVYFLKQPMQDIPNDGAGADWHPSAITQKKCAEQLTSFIRTII